MRSLLAALGAAAALVAGPLVGVAAAAPIGSCTSTSGTIIAVDYSHWNGPVVRGCDTSQPKRGIDLLTDLGFSTAGDSHDGPQFLCRIGNQAFEGGTQYPTPATEACVVTPPASAYWSYWLAKSGQNTWTYSQLGAYSEAPEPGEVELWIFGGTNIAGTQGTPTCSPASLRAGGSAAHCSPTGSTSGSPSDTPSGKHSSSQVRTRHSSGGGASTDAAHASTGAGGASGPQAGGGGAVGRSAASTAPSHGRGSTAAKVGKRASLGASTGTQPGTLAASQAGAQIVEAKPAAEHRSSPGSAVPLIVGIGLATILTAGGGFTMWRRRQAE